MLRQPASRALRSCISISRHSHVSITRTYVTSKPPRPPALAEYKGSGRAKTPPPSTRARQAPQPNIKSTSPSLKSTAPSGIENQPSPSQGTRQAVGSASYQSPLKQEGKAKEPEAQKQDLDSPPIDGLRAEIQAEQATAENTQAPPRQPEQPLPDLRFGIPSTFAKEFNQRLAADEKDASPESAEASSAGGAGGGRRDNEEDFNRTDFQTSIDRRRAKTARWGYLMFLATGVFGGAYFARPFSTAAEDVPAGLDPADAAGWDPRKMYRRVRARMGDQLGYYTEPSFTKLLPDMPETQRPPFTLVLSLEDLLVHSQWDRANGYRMAKRPGVDYFVRYLSPYYELVLFTSVPIAIADPVIKKLDPYHLIMWPLGREATKYEGGEFVKDLSYLNRDLKKTLIIDTVKGHVKNQPENAIVLPKWSGEVKDPHTNDLVALIPFLEYIATMNIEDVREVIKSFEGKHIPTEFARREALAREAFEKERAADRFRKPKRSLGSVLGKGLGIQPDRTGGMAFDGQSVAQGLAEGKMLSDLIREQGQKQYEFLDKQIREQGAQWLKDEEEEQKRLIDEQMKEMKKNPVGTLARWFGGAEPPKKE